MKAAVHEALIDDIASFSLDPEGFVDFAYDWGHGELADVYGPREWQREELAQLGAHLQNGETRFQPYQAAVASGHGIGKSALIGMIVTWAMSTCDDCKVVITANTDNQLRTKTAPEVGTWVRRAITADWFNVDATAISSRDKKHSRTWRADFVPWSENNTEAFAGLHNKRKRIVLIMDEGSAIADKIFEVAEGALTDEETEIIWLVFGNPTRNTGRFRECFRRYRHRWHHKQIDSRAVEGTNKEQIAKWAADYGEDSDWFKIRVRGMFPDASPKQFISAKDVDAAFGRHLRAEQYNFAPVILTCDPAWSGDDELVIGKRQGLRFDILLTMPKNDNDVDVANKLARLEQEHKAAAVFIDAGFGTGIFSAGSAMGRSWQLVWFSGASSDPGCLNKRMEMWKQGRDWLKAGGAIPNDDVLYQDLIGPELVSRLDGKMQLEGKDAMKARGVPSPNRADALMLSFAFPVEMPNDIGQSGHVAVDYDPYN